MKFHLENAPGRHLFTGYGAGDIAINQTRHETSVVVAADRLLFDWPARWDDLAVGHFELLLSLKPEIVILGSGARQRFPHPALFQSLTAARIGVEAMDTPAACRTYNILIAEGRNVVAAVIPA